MIFSTKLEIEYFAFLRLSFVEFSEGKKDAIEKEIKERGKKLYCKSMPQMWFKYNRNRVDWGK